MPAKEFHLKQKFALGDNFSIKDSLGQKCYQVKGSPGQFGDQASFQTLAGTELAALKQTNNTKLLPWKKFVWEKDGKPWALAKQDDWGALDKKSISIDIPGENDYKILGDRICWHFKIFKGEEQVGEVDKKWGVLDNYGVKVYDGADEVDILLCGILIDAIYHDDERKGR